MENKGLNTYINEIENTMAKMINEYLQQGVPPTVIELILKSSLYQVEKVSQEVVRQEIQRFEEENKKQKETSTNKENKDKNN